MEQIKEEFEDEQEGEEQLEQKDDADEADQLNEKLIEMNQEYSEKVEETRGRRSTRRGGL